MKKIITLSLVMMSVMAASSQALKQVNYRGAFAPAPTTMWTNGWTNWDPQNADYGAPDTTVTGHITTNTTFSSGHVYLLSGVVYVDSLVTLTIQPGTVIRGNNAVPNSALLVRRGGKLMAEGTACSPIVFTSSLPKLSRNKGDWGGVILLGRARINQLGGIGYIEGLAQSPDNAFGGTDDADNSGSLKYVRIEYGGYVFAPNQEINGLTFGGVGAGTTIDNVQVSFSNDDSYEWFGGNVNCTHLVAYRGLDDDFDTDNGFSGKVQFALGVRDPNIADNPAVSTSEGFESDNDANGSTNTPQTSAIFSNVTEIGPYRGSTSTIVAAGFRRGARIRRNSALKIVNSILMDYATGLHIDGAAAFVNANSGLLKFKNNIVALAGTNQIVAQNNGDTSRSVFFAAANHNDSLGTTAGILINPYDFLIPDYRPAPLSLALSNYDFSDIVLPITLTSFNGETVKTDNFLYWETSTETNNTGFDVQRSVNGQSYTSIGFVASQALNGNSTSANRYVFADRNVRADKAYYRLKQVDKDGHFMLSNIVVLSRMAPSKLNLAVVYPNPVKGSVVNVEIGSPVAQTVRLLLTNASGQTIRQQQVALTAGINNYQLIVQSIAGGNYYLTMISTDGTPPQVKKFIRQ